MYGEDTLGYFADYLNLLLLFSLIPMETIGNYVSQNLIGSIPNLILFSSSAQRQLPKFCAWVRIPILGVARRHASGQRRPQAEGGGVHFEALGMAHQPQGKQISTFFKNNIYFYSESADRLHCTL
jgi:hypothetical protein